MNATKMLLGSIAVALFAATAAHAQADPGTDRPTSKAQAKFDKLDRDKDGTVSKSEARKDAKLEAEFAAVDQDADGSISRSEYTAMTQTRPPSQDMPIRNHQPNDYGQPPPQ